MLILLLSKAEVSYLGIEKKNVIEKKGIVIYVGVNIV